MESFMASSDVSFSPVGLHDAIARELLPAPSDTRPQRHGCCRPMMKHRAN